MALDVDRVLRRKGLRRADLTRLLGKSNNSYVTNAMKNPTLETLQTFAKVLNVDVKDFFIRENKNKDIYLILDDDLKKFYNLEDLKKFVDNL